MSGGTTNPARFFNGMGTLGSFLGPTDSDNELVAERKRKELAFLRKVLGRNARYLSMSLPTIESSLLHGERDAANQITKSAYGMSLRLGTKVGGYYRFFASPSFGASSFGNAREIDIAHRISNN